MRCCDAEQRNPATGDNQKACQQENPNRKRPSEECEDTRRDRSKQRKGDVRCSRGVESSKRFSVRVMEAMRALQRQKEAQAKGQRCGPPCSSVCEIVEYVNENFCTDGDLDAQVRTALKRTCCQGFVKYERNDAYRLVDPFVCQMMKTQQANSTTSMSSLTARRCIHDPCEQNNNNNNDTPYNRNGAGDTDQVQDSSENELSLPSSAADDVLWRRMQNQQNSQQNNNSAGDRACPPNPRSCNPNRNQDPCSSSQNQPPPCGGPCSGGQNHNQPPRCGGPCGAQPSQSSAAGSGASGRVAAPVGELEVSFSNGDDDDDDDEEESGEENEGRNGANEDVEQDDEDEEEEEEDGEEDEEEEEEEDDNESEDSVLNELDRRNRRPQDEARDRELKRWIRQCRKECERQARQRRAQ